MRTRPTYVQPVVAVRAIRLEQRLSLPGGELMRNVLVGTLGLVSGMLGAILAATL